MRPSVFLQSLQLWHSSSRPDAPFIRSCRLRLFFALCTWFLDRDRVRRYAHEPRLRDVERDEIYDCRRCIGTAESTSVRSIPPPSRIANSDPPLIFVSGLLSIPPSRRVRSP